MDEVKPTTKEIETFKKTIMSLLPAATRVAKRALVIKKRSRGKDKDKKSQVKLEPKSIDFARWVLQQYAKFALPDAPDQHEVHFVDHAMLAQIEQAKKVAQEINNYRKSRQAHRGINADLN